MAPRDKPLGTCAICGEIGPLSFEHVPPRAAFNDRQVLLVDTQHWLANLESGESDTRLKRQPKGAGAFTLCRRCNADTGAWYGRRYAQWAYQGMTNLLAAPAGSSLALPYHVFPQPVFKQALCMFASACGPTLCGKNPALIRYILNRDATDYPGPFRLYCYLMSPESTRARQLGMSGVLNLGGANHLLSEIAFPPFGYVLSEDATPIDSRLVDITEFFRHRYNEFRTLHLRLPVLEINSVYPGDYRTVGEMDDPRNSLA